MSCNEAIAAINKKESRHVVEPELPGRGPRVTIAYLVKRMCYATTYCAD